MPWCSARLFAGLQQFIAIYYCICGAAHLYICCVIQGCIYNVVDGCICSLNLQCICNAAGGQIVVLLAGVFVL